MALMQSSPPFSEKVAQSRGFFIHTTLSKCRTEFKCAVAIGWCARLRLRWDFGGIIYSTMDGNMDVNLLDMLHVFINHIMIEFMAI